MATYVYETVPPDDSVASRRFEYRQSMKDAALTHDPATGLPVRRVILGGLGHIGAKRGTGGMAADGGMGTCCPGCHN